MNKNNTPDVLRQIADDKTAECERRKQLTPNIQQLANDAPPTRDFAGALTNNSPHAIIAEIKYKSPSRGVLRTDFSPITLAQQYQSGGAACLSVLTDEPYFGGKDEHLQQARNACNLPVLRKDFMVDEWQIYESRALAADAVLLIAALLSLAEMQSMAKIAHQLGMAVLVESHNQQELEMSLAVDNAIIGINNRNLSTFQTSLQTCIDLLPIVHNAEKNVQQDNRLIIAESGIETHADITKLANAGATGFLIGETLMRAANPSMALKELLMPT